LSVSPFLNDDASAEKFTMSAVKRCAASSKLMRVRVDGSMKRLTTVCRAARDFLDGAFADGFERLRRVEHGDDFISRERFDVEQMFFGPGHFIYWPQKNA